jgi:hypothetical protein
LKRGESWGGMGLHFPSQDAFAIETQGPIQDRTKEHLGSSDIVITAVRTALRNAIRRVLEGKEAPGLIQDHSDGLFPDFICTSGYIDEHEDGPGYCRKILTAKSAAE